MNLNLSTKELRTIDESKVRLARTTIEMLIQSYAEDVKAFDETHSAAYAIGQAVDRLAFALMQADLAHVVATVVTRRDGGDQ